MREICRNFQRGSCQYGQRCKFLHVQQQQRKSNAQVFGGQSADQQQNSNPFGFGSQTGPHQQQKTNPFGFGMHSSSQLKGGTNFESQPNQFKPFENKWNRLSSKPQNGASRQSDNHSQPVNHQCTDPEICKRQIAEDFQHEKPLWTLTCYSHCKGAPCDVVGDISYEELRTAAYEDAKRGMSLQSIVEKERSILSSKLVEFEKLLSEPYTVPLNSSFTSPKHPSTGANANPFSRTTQNNGPLSVSSFSQLGSSLNMGFERPSAAVMNSPVLPNSFGSGGNSLAFNMASIGSGGISGAQSSLSSTLPGLTMFPVSTSQQSSFGFNESSSTTMFPTRTDAQLLNKSQVENVSGDASIWLKDKWKPGEIPEEAPPDAFIW